MDAKRIDKLLMMLSAILIIADLAIFGDAKAGVICYWAIVALYHLADLIQDRDKEERDEDQDE